jgi:hypothetical protein
MSKCRFCDHDNSPGVERCQGCGAWLEQKAESSGPAPAQPAESELPDADSLEGQVLALLQGAKKIQAIKLYRSQTGADLMHAKQAVEALAAKHNLVASSSGGCAGVVLLALLAAFTIFFAGAWLLA